ncbi:pentatricopeptide repeat-containing protein [Striga asiatica]|uniref:Pentatricopeptide repeat-containing protein n=1 Tax=Striga asiatica TaxID=4170 RepID=A0A5A7PLJ1_STRAF|nr:pentatricopeptide repeat-containing protein [Striga asiatica]
MEQTSCEPCWSLLIERGKDGMKIANELLILELEALTNRARTRFLARLLNEPSSTRLVYRPSSIFVSVAVTELHELLMELLKSSFLPSFPANTPPKPRKLNKPPPPKVLCCLKPDPWSPRSGKNLEKPKPIHKTPKNPLSDDDARSIIKAKARYLSALRRNQGSRVQTPKWIKRTPEQMVQYLEDDRNGHMYGRHVVAAIKRVRSTSKLREGEYDMREVMGSFVAKLTFKEMCVVLKEQKSWRQLSYRPSVIAYTVVLRAYGQIGKIKLAEETFLEMLEAGCEPDEIACGTMLCSYARWGRHKAMLSFYSALQDRGILLPLHVFNFMLSSLQKNSLHRDVVHVWQKMIEQGVSPNHFTYTVVISSLVKAGMVEEALVIFHEMKNLGFVPDEATYSLLIRLNCKNGEKDKALHLYKDMKSHDKVPSHFTCASLLALYYRTADYVNARSLFTEMEKHGVIADETIYGLMIRIYGKLGLYEDAVRTFSEIERSGQLSDEKTYATMAQVHINFGNFGKASDLMERMRSKNISFSRFSCIVQLECCILKGDIASAENAFRAISKTGPADATSCKDMLNLYARLGLLEKAIAFVEQLRKDQIDFNEELFVIVLEVYCKGGMLREVEQLIVLYSVRETFKNIPFVRTFFMVMYGQCNGSNDHENFFEPSGQSGALAVELMLTLCLAARNEKKMKGKVELLLDTKIGESVGNRMISKFAQESDMLNTVYLYELMIRNGCKIEDAARASIISLYGKQKKLKQAEEVFFDGFGSAKDLYSSMIDAYVTCGRVQNAYLFFKEQTTQGHSLGAVAISKLVKALTSCGKHDESEKVISYCLNLNLELDTVAYNTFLKAKLEAGKLRSAISIYERMLNLKISPSIYTYNTMISVYGKLTNFDKVVEMFELAQSMGMTLDEKTYTNMICHYGKAGKVNEAAALFNKMLEDGIKPGQMSYNIMINVYAADGLYKEAEKLLLSMQKNNCRPNSQTYLLLIRAYTRGFQYSEAEKVIDAMQREGISVSCGHFNFLILAYAKSGSIGEAERIYRKIISTGLMPDLKSKSMMLRTYVDFGLVEQGIRFYESECRLMRPNWFLSSAAVHLYRSVGEELQADEILNAMNDLGATFLSNLKIGTRT